MQFARPASLLALACLVVSLGPLPARADQAADIVAARSLYLEAKQKEKAAKQRVERAQRTLDRAGAALQDLLSENTRRYDALTARIADLEADIQAKLREQVEAEAGPAALKDEYVEARRRYDEARPIVEIIGRSQLLHDLPEWRRIEDRVRTLSRELNAAQEEGARRSAAIEQEIKALQDRRQALLRELEQAMELPSSGPAFIAFHQAALAAAEAQGEAAAAETATGIAFDSYGVALRPAPPPWLSSLSVSSGGRDLYRARWAVTPGGRESPEQLLRRERLRQPLHDLSLAIDEKESERRQLREQRLELAEMMHPLAQKLEPLALKIAELQQKKIVAAALVEITGTIAEVALTGGMATAARKASELATDAGVEAGLQLAARRAADPRARALLRMEEEVAAASRAVERHSIETARRIEEPWQQLREAVGRRARERALREGTDPDRAARMAIAQFASQHNRLAELPALRQRWARRATALQDSLEKTGGKLAIAAESKFGSAAVMNEVAQEPLGELVGNPVAADVAGVVVGDLYEQAFARAGTVLVQEGVDGAAAASVRIAGDGVRGWQALKTGASAFAGSQVNLPRLKETIAGTRNGNLLALGTTAVKAAVTAYYSAQEWEATQDYWTTMADLDLRYAVYVRALEADRELVELIRERRKEYAEISGFINATRGPRAKRVEIDETPEDRTGPVEFLLTFSGPLRTAPSLTVGGHQVPVVPRDMGPEGASFWSGRLSLRELPESLDEAPVTVSLSSAEGPYPQLDGDPSTHSHIDIEADLENKATSLERIWTGYEAKPDGNHALRLADRWAGLWKRGETILRLTREGQAVIGHVVTPSAAARSERGYEPGEKVLEGTVEGETLRSRALVKYTREWRSRCPESTYWSPILYRAHDRGRLSGEWEDRILDRTCGVVSRERLQDTLIRVGPAEPR